MLPNKYNSYTSPIYTIHCIHTHTDIGIFNLLSQFRIIAFICYFIYIESYVLNFYACQNIFFLSFLSLLFICFFLSGFLSFLFFYVSVYFRYFFLLASYAHSLVDFLEFVDVYESLGCWMWPICHSSFLHLAIVCIYFCLKIVDGKVNSLFSTYERSRFLSHGLFFFLLLLFQSPIKRSQRKLTLLLGRLTSQPNEKKMT